jgi:hypothetical protein
LRFPNTRRLYRTLARRDTDFVKMNEWWPLVSAETRHWLVEHNGEPLTPQITSDIMSVTSGATGPEWWAGESADGPQLTDAAVDWIEAVANGEDPAPTL